MFRNPASSRTSRIESDSMYVEWEWSGKAKRDGKDGADEVLSSAHCPLDLWTSL